MCCNCRVIAYDCYMKHSNHIEKIAELSESEGVFTTAQAARMGIPRDALHDAVESGRLVRVVRGAYRMVGSGSSFTDELAAIWKLTAPATFSHERMRVSDWDGIAVGGSTASALLGIGVYLATIFSTLWLTYFDVSATARRRPSYPRPSAFPSMSAAPMRRLGPPNSTSRP
jgi:hypothetical protein